MSETQSLILDQLCTYIGRGISPKYDDSGDFRVINQKCIRDFKLSLNESRKHSSKLKRVSTEKTIHKYDVLINSTGVGTLGRVAQVLFENTSNTTVDSHVTIARPNRSKIDPVFFGYLIKEKQHIIEALGEGSTGQTELSRDHIKKLTVKIPTEIKSQIEIGAILKSLDDKIEHNRQMNETLEAIAKSIFKSWFVDFEPVKAKARLAGNYDGDDMSLEEARAYLKNIDPEIAGLFPDSFEESELGMVPKGWEACDLSEIIELNPAEKLPKTTKAPYLEMSNLPTQGTWPEVPIIRGFTSGAKFRNGDALMARITPCLENGKTAFIQCLENNQIGWGSTEFIVLRSKEAFPPECCYLLARSSSFRQFAIQSMTGSSGRQRVQTDSLKNFMTTKAPKSIYEVFGKVTFSMFYKIRANSFEIQTLIKLRDLLLPQLISGEIRVKLN